MSYKKLKIGDELSAVQRFKVITPYSNRGGNPEIIVEDLKGQKIRVVGEEVLQSLVPASHFTKTEKVTRTELQEKVLNSVGVTIQCNFSKTPTPERAMAALKGATAKQRNTKAWWTRNVLTGEEETADGYVDGEMDSHGFIKFYKVQNQREGSHFVRRINPRGLNWAIIRGVKYEVKK